MFSEWLLKSTFEVNLKTSRWNYTIEYEQASIWETIEFYIKTEKEHILIWLYKFIQEHTKKKPWYKFRGMSKKDFLDLWEENLKKLFEQIKDTRFRLPKQRKAWGDDSPFESFLAFLAEKLCVPPHILLKEYTFEQAVLLARGIEYNVNMQSPEWELRNAQNKAWDEMNEWEDFDMEAIKKLRDLKDNQSKNA